MYFSAFSFALPAFFFVFLFSNAADAQRKLAKSLMMVMDTQDSTPGFEPLPVLPGGRAPNMDYKKPMSAEDALAALVSG